MILIIIEFDSQAQRVSGRNLSVNNAEPDKNMKLAISLLEV